MGCNDQRPVWTFNFIIWFNWFKLYHRLKCVHTQWIQCLYFINLTGFRSVPLKNGYSENIELASLLVYISVQQAGVRTHGHTGTRAHTLTRWERTSVLLYRLCICTVCSTSLVVITWLSSLRKQRRSCTRPQVSWGKNKLRSATNLSCTTPTPIYSARLLLANTTASQESTAPATRTGTPQFHSVP